jgi:hypothetical protein
MADQRDIDGLLMLLWKMRNCTLQQQAEAIFAWLEGDDWEPLAEEERAHESDAQPSHEARDRAV